MLQSYFIGALQNPSKTATIQWLIFDETGWYVITKGAILPLVC